MCVTLKNCCAIHTCTFRCKKGVLGTDHLHWNNGQQARTIACRLPRRRQFLPAQSSKSHPRRSSSASGFSVRLRPSCYSARVTSQPPPSCGEPILTVRALSAQVRHGLTFRCELSPPRQEHGQLDLRLDGGVGRPLFFEPRQLARYHRSPWRLLIWVKNGSLQPFSRIGLCTSMGCDLGQLQRLYARAGVRCGSDMTRAQKGESVHQPDGVAAIGVPRRPGDR